MAGAFRGRTGQLYLHNLYEFMIKTLIVLLIGTPAKKKCIIGAQLSTRSLRRRGQILPHKLPGDKFPHFQLFIIQ